MLLYTSSRKLNQIFSFLSVPSLKGWNLPKVHLFHVGKIISTQKAVNIWTPSCKIWRPWGEMGQISPGGSHCLLHQDRQCAITVDFQGYNKHSPKNLSQIQEDQSYPIYLTAPCYQSHLARGALDISKGGHCARKSHSSSVAIWPKGKHGFECGQEGMTKRGGEYKF